MFTNIVWATDGSEHADRALAYAIGMAKRDGAELHVAHVVEKLVGARVAGQNTHLDEEKLDEKIRRQTREIAAEQGLKATLHMTAGRAGEIAARIAEVATDAGAELIVVGTRGHSAVVAAMIGSVTQRLLHVAPCAVLAVPPLAVAADPVVAADPAVVVDPAVAARPAVATG